MRALVVTVAVALLACGCGGGSVGGTGGTGPPVIVSGAGALTVPVGGSVDLAVTATGESPLAYRWETWVGGDWSEVVEATGPSWTTPALAAEDDGLQVRCVVTNGLGAAVSDRWTLGVRRVLMVRSGAAAGGDGLSWATAVGELRDALAAATGVDEVWVAAGTYVPTSGADRTASFTLVAGVALYGGFAGDEVAREDRSVAANETVLSGDIGVAAVATDNSYHVVVGATGATLDGFTVTAGQADGASAPWNSGGGMLIESGGPTVSGCTFRGNHAVNGGAAFLYGDSARVEGCTFVANGATDDGGGLSLCFSLTTVLDCVFEDNTAGSRGGGLSMNVGYLSLTRCSFRGNAAGTGGAVAGIDADGAIWTCLFVDNAASADAGALYWGEYVDEPGAVEVVNCTMTGNSGTTANAVVAPVRGANLRNCLVWGNDAGGVPPLYLYGGGGVIWSCVEGGFAGTGNTAEDPLFVDAAGGDLRLAAGSPCVDAANGDVSPLVDIDGLGRWDDPTVEDTGTGTPTYVDMGAHEYQGP